MTRLLDEILLCNILPRLPSKSLLRCRCVCKSWDSFIRSPSFLRLRKLTNTSTHHIIFLSLHPLHPQPSQTNVYSAPLPNNTTIVTNPPRASLLFNFPHARVNSVNGLLCFHPHSKVRFSSHVNVFTLVANLTTRQIVTLPVDDNLGQEFMVSTHFGYDPVRDEFKVLRFVKYDKFDGSHEFKIFTVGVDTSWRDVNVQTPLGLITMMERLVWSGHGKKSLCVNGAIYWNFLIALLVFDVGTEQFREMPLPSECSRLERNFRHFQYQDLMEIDGCLCLFGYRGHDLKLWILRDCRDRQWEQKSVVIPSVVVFPLCRVSTGEILLVPYFLPVRVRGVYYDMDTMRFRSVVVMEMPQPLLAEDIVFCEESFRVFK